MGNAARLEDVRVYDNDFEGRDDQRTTSELLGEEMFRYKHIALKETTQRVSAFERVLLRDLGGGRPRSWFVYDQYGSEAEREAMGKFRSLQNTVA